jgi:flagellar capping protein FliD
MATGIDIGGFIGSNFDGDKAIDKIIAVEKKKRTPIEMKQFIAQAQKEAWQGLQKKLNDLNNNARNLFSPLYSPFRQTKSTSSNNDLIEIMSDKTDPSKMKPGEYNIIPKQMAKSDHFRSDAIDGQDKLAKGQFTIVYQGKKYKINFPGGSLQELSNMVSKTIGEFANVNILDIGENKSVLDIETKEIGKKHALTFEGDTDFLKKIGLLKNATPTFEDLLLTQSKGLSSNQDIQTVLKDSKVILNPNDYIKKTFDLPKIVKKDSQLWIYLTFDKKSKKDSKSNAPSPNDTNTFQNQTKEQDENAPIQGILDKIWVGDVQLYGESLLTELLVPSKSPLNAKDTPSKKGASQNSVNPNTSIEVTLETEQGVLHQTLSYNENQTRLQILKFPLKEGNINSVQITNKGIYPLSIQKGEIETSHKGTFIPKNSISKAQNALINYKGTDYERESNSIKDVVPGVSFNLKGESQKPVKLNVDWDYNLILSKIQDFVVTYNNAMDYIKHVNKNRTTDPSGKSYSEEMQERKAKYDKMTDKERQEAAVDGSLYDTMLSSDSAVRSIKTKLQSITTAPYETDLKQKLMFLSQLGIKRPGFNDMNISSVQDQENFRAGYLEFTKEDQDKFLNLLKSEPKSVSQLFFKRSTPEHILYDKGLAVDMNNLLEKIVATNFRGEDKRVYSGLIKVKIDMLNRSITQYATNLKQFDSRLDKQRNKLQNDFGKVYAAQNQAKANQSQLERFSK